MAPGRVAELSPGEQFWADHRDWLQDLGYLLRPRFQPDWVPTWTKITDILFREDAQSYSLDSIMDATVAADGSFVMMKKLKASSPELDIAVFFSTEPQRSDPANHCVPVRVLSDSNDPGWAIIVMPLLRRYDKPRFDTIGEAVEFFSQIFEGVQFMHKNNVAHRDCTSNNIMMDGACLYRTPFHPLRQSYTRDFSRTVSPSLTRTQHPVKYYLTDFGLSRRYKAEDRPPLEPTVRAGDKTAPEFDHLAACDPFPTDVYYLGNLIRTEFLDGGDTSCKLGFEFMRPLVNAMVQPDPSLRPDMDEVVARLRKIVSGLSSWKLRTRVVKVKSTTAFGPYYFVTHWFRRIQFILRRVPPIPVP